MSPKTADYIPSGGGVIATLLGCTLMTLLWRTLLQREALKVFRENMICSAITVYSLAIPCFPSRRVSIDSRVWNRNADDCFYRIVSWKSGVYPGRERLHTFCGRSTLQLTITLNNGQKCKYYINIHYLVNAPWGSSGNFMFWKSLNFAEYCSMLSLLMCTRPRVACHTCRDLDYCSKQGRGTSQHAIIATYHRSVKQWNVFIDLESIVFFRFNSTAMDTGLTW